MRTRLVGWIPFGRRLLHQQRDQELAARKATAPQGNVEKIAGASPETTARRDKEDGFA